MKCKVYKISVSEYGTTRTAIVPAQNSKIPVNELERKGLKVDKCEYLGWFLVDIIKADRAVLAFEIHFERHKTTISHKDFGYQYLKERFGILSKGVSSDVQAEKMGLDMTV